MNARSGGFVLRGLVAGAIGAWVMDRVTWAMQDRQRRQDIARERAAWPDQLDVSHALGWKMAGQARLPASKEQPSTLGMATHYMLGIAPALIYAGLRERDLRYAKDGGLLYGFLIFALWDETLSVATGIAGPPTRYPWQSHARGLLGHLALGVATHVALNAMERDFDRRPIVDHPGA